MVGVVIDCYVTINCTSIFPGFYNVVVIILPRVFYRVALEVR
jgi:hypothetical protein